MDGSPWRERYERLEARGLARAMRSLAGPVGPVADTPDGPVLLFCSNDYLGLAADLRLVDAIAAGARRWGAGAASSRLVSGNTRAHDEAEARLAAFVGSQRAVLFPSGYQANVGAIPALAGEGDAIFSDELAHASIVDGCRLSRARVEIFRHRDAAHLADLVDTCSAPGLKLVVSDAVFSMDGDTTPLREIAEICRSRGAHLYLDEAHSLGVIGEGGRGLAAREGLADRAAVRVGTLGKAFGLCGAFVACDPDAAGLVRSAARSLLYTTAAPAFLAEAIPASVDAVEAADDRRERLEERVGLFRTLAREAGLPVLASQTAIQPVIAGSAERAVAVSRALWERGIFVQAIRPPTVPEGGSRLRVTLTAAHETGHVERLVRALVEALEEAGP